jgi:hypothetical protein
MNRQQRAKLRKGTREWGRAEIKIRPQLILWHYEQGLAFYGQCSVKSVMTSYSQKESVMKIHNDFTLYFRVAPSGKRVVYFYAYDKNGRRAQG